MTLVFAEPRDPGLNPAGPGPDAGKSNGNLGSAARLPVMLWVGGAGAVGAPLNGTEGHRGPADPVPAGQPPWCPARWPWRSGSCICRAAALTTRGQMVGCPAPSTQRTLVTCGYRPKWRRTDGPF